VALHARARVRDPSNLGPTLNATGTRETGYQRQCYARLPPAARQQLSILSVHLGRTNL